MDNSVLLFRKNNLRIFSQDDSIARVGNCRSRKLRFVLRYRRRNDFHVRPRRLAWVVTLSRDYLEEHHVARKKNSESRRVVATDVSRIALCRIYSTQRTLKIVCVNVVCVINHFVYKSLRWLKCRLASCLLSACPFNAWVVSLGNECYMYNISQRHIRVVSSFPYFETTRVYFSFPVNTI